MGLPPLTIPKDLSLSNGLYEALRNAIIQGDLKPGDKLTELSVAAHAKISRTPVREALRRLQNEGMLELAGRSLIVSSISIEALSKLCVVRATLEGLAARLAAEKRSESDLYALENINEDIKNAVEQDHFHDLVRLNHAFHSFIWQIAQNDYLKQQLFELRESIVRVQTSTLHSKKRQNETIQEHESILQAIKSSDEKAAEQLTREHFEKAETLRITMLRMKTLK